MGVISGDDDYGLQMEMEMKTKTKISEKSEWEKLLAARRFKMASLDTSYIIRMSRSLKLK